MKTGIIRRIDDLGRIVIPKEIRRILHLKEGDPLEICVDDGHILLELYDGLGFSKDRWKPYLAAFHAQYNTPTVVFGSKNEQLFSCGGKITLAARLSDAAKYHLENGIEYVRGLDIEADELTLTEKEKYAVDAIVPIHSGLDHLGTLVLFGLKNSFPTSEQVDCLKLLSRIIAKEME